MAPVTGRERIIARGKCAACEGDIVGQVLTAMGRTYHPEHFLCHVCRHPLGNASFYERNGNAYCEHDYCELFNPRCAYCNTPIIEVRCCRPGCRSRLARAWRTDAGEPQQRCITALGKTWHPEHFLCSHCSKAFESARFMEHDGLAFCESCYFTLFAATCAGCAQTIMDEYVTALDRKWHTGCFVCTVCALGRGWLACCTLTPDALGGLQDCRQPFDQMGYFERDGKPYCETHFHALNNSLCMHCRKAIVGRCITAAGQRFHPEHFVCAHCQRALDTGLFKSHQAKPYCVTCHTQLFG